MYIVCASTVKFSPLDHNITYSIKLSGEDQLDVTVVKDFLK